MEMVTPWPHQSKRQRNLMSMLPLLLLHTHGDRLIGLMGNVTGQSCIMTWNVYSYITSVKNDYICPSIRHLMIIITIIVLKYVLTFGRKMIKRKNFNDDHDLLEFRINYKIPGCDNKFDFNELMNDTVALRHKAVMVVTNMAADNLNN